VKAESLPSGTSADIQRGDDDHWTGSFCVELGAGREDVGYKRGPDPEVRVAAVDRKTAEQQCWNRIRRSLRQ
jgi:hypothetical protein